MVAGRYPRTRHFDERTEVAEAEDLIAASDLLKLDGSCVIRRLAVAETILGTDMANKLV